MEIGGPCIGKHRRVILTSEQMGEGGDDVVRQRMDLLELVREQAAEADLDFLREAMGVLVQAIMEAEVVTQIGAEQGERSALSAQAAQWLP